MPAKRRPLTLQFDAKLYPAPAVREAARAFAELTEAKVTVGAAKIKVRLVPVPGAPADEILAGELGNYALGLACDRRRKR